MRGVCLSGAPLIDQPSLWHLCRSAPMQAEVEGAFLPGCLGRSSPVPRFQAFQLEVGSSPRAGSTTPSRHHALFGSPAAVACTGSSACSPMAGGAKNSLGCSLQGTFA